MKTTLAWALAAVLAAGAASQSWAQPRPQTLVNQRKAAMMLQGKYFAPVYSMTIGSAPYDPAVVQRNADYLAVLSQMPWDDFQPNTIGVGNTRAKEDIHQADASAFKEKAESLQTGARALAAAARGGDRAAVTTAARNVARTCNGCHESHSSFEYRYPIQ
jgi:cytochrome c556